MAQNHQKRDPVPPWGAPEGSVVKVDGQNQRGYCLGCFLAVFGPMWPRNSVCWAQNGLIWAPNVSCGLKPKNGRISGWTDRIANPWTLFPRANPHCRWFPPLQMAQTHRYKRSLPTGCPFSRIRGDFGLCRSTEKGSRMVENRSKSLSPKRILDRLGCLERWF